MSVPSLAIAIGGLAAIRGRMALWLRVLSDGFPPMFGSLVRREDAFGADDLPVSFILERDSRRKKSGNGKRRYPIVVTAVKGIDRRSGVRLAAHRAHARSALRPNANRADNNEAA